MWTVIAVITGVGLSALAMTAHTWYHERRDVRLGYMPGATRNAVLETLDTKFSTFTALLILGIILLIAIVAFLAAAIQA